MLCKLTDQLITNEPVCYLEVYMRTNEAKFIESRNRWQINVRDYPDRKTFACSPKDFESCRTTACSEKCTKGKISAEKKADKWLEKRIVNENTRCDILLDEFLERVKLTGGKGHHRQTESFVRIRIRPRIGSKKVGYLTQDDLQAIVDHAYVNEIEGYLDINGEYVVNKWKGKKLSKKTLMDLRGAIMSFIKFCRSKNASSFHPETLSIPTGAKASAKTILHIEDIITLFTVDTTLYKGKLVKDWFIHLYRFRLVSGVRPGESIALREPHFKDTRIKISESINIYNELTHGKNKNATRTYTLDEHAMKIKADQKAMLMEAGQISPYIFPGYNGEHATQSEVYGAWKRYCKANGIKNATTPYELRHTFNSVNAEMPLALRRLILGHSENMDTDGIYGHEKADDMDTAAGYINDAFKKILGW